MFGLAFLLVPGFTLLLFLYAFGIMLILGGIALVVTNWNRSQAVSWRALNLLEGAFVIILGLIALVAPGFTALMAIYLVGVFAIVTGILQIVEGFAVPRGHAIMGTTNRTWLIISGLWSFIIGILLVVFPGAGVLALLWMVGILLIIVGVLNIASGLKIRTEVKQAEPVKEH